MTLELGASGELEALAEAIGLLDVSGNLDVSWFSAPLTRVGSMLRTPQQRQAVSTFLDLALPGTTEPGRPPAEKWHPLLGTLPNGNLYLTVRDTGSGLVIGIGGDFHSGTGAAVQGRLRVQGDIISAGAALDVVVGSVASPIVVEVRVETAMTYDPAHGSPVGLAAVVGRFTIVTDPSHAGVGLTLILEQLSLAGETPVDKQLDVDELGRDAPDLLAALVKVVLASAGVDPTISMLADHLMALLGLADTDAIPAFPFAEVGDGPVAIQQWFATLVGADGSTPTASAWLGHLAGLLGISIPPIGTGDLATPWQARLFAFPGAGGLDVTLARVDGHVRVGLSVGVDAALGAGEPHVGIAAQIGIADIPLGGTAHAVPLPAASVFVRITGDTGNPLVADPTVTVGVAQLGVTWDGARLGSTVELLDNHFAGTPYPVLDLSNAESVESAAATLVVSAIDAALGNDVGRRIAAIVGLVPPEDPAAPGTPISPWTHQLDLATLVTNPARAIGAYHLGVLGDGDRWSLILREIAHLVGLSGAVTGSGTEAQPWAVPIAPTDGSPGLALAAWHGPATDAPTTQQLRLGLTLGASPGGATFGWTGEVLAFDLPASGPGAVRLVGRQQVSLVMSPALDATDGPIHLRLDDLELAAGWAPGESFAVSVHAHGLTIDADGDSLTINDLHLPPAGGFDLTDLASTAAALGLTVTNLEQVFRLILSTFAGLAGPEAEVAAGLVGIRRGLSGLSEDAPTIVDPAQPGLLLNDPLGALRGWLDRLFAHVGTAGQSSAVELLQWLSTLAADAVGDLEAELAPDLLAGAGTFADPWRLPWPGGGGRGPELEVWLDPQGPPTAWVAGLLDRASAAGEYADLATVLTELSWHDPALASMIKGLTSSALTERLRGLDVYLNSGDGVVPRDSQGPDIFGWVHDIEVDAAHHTLPAQPDAIAEILTQIEALHGAGARTVLLVGPSFADHTVWQPLLDAPQRQGPTDPGAHFDLRAAGIDPLTISLDDITAVADYYTADLADNGLGDPAYLAGQIAHIADRLDTLHPGPIVVVAHSYAGLAARRFAADDSARVQALITVGTPHLGAPLSFLTDPEIGDAVRIAGVLRPSMAASVVRDALDHLTTGLEGYLPPPSAGALATAHPYPVASFAMTAPFDLGTIPVVTLGGVITDDVFEWLRSALIAHIDLVASVATADPTHIGYGMAMPLPLGTGVSGTPDVEARARFALGQIPLGSAAAVQSGQLVRVELDLVRDDGWIVGGPAGSDVDGRARRVQVGVTSSHGPSGVQAAVDATISQAAWRGVTVPTADLSDPRAAALIGAAFAQVLASTDSSELPISGLASALSALDLLTTDAQGVTGLSSDGFAALRTDPVGYLRGRVPTALARPKGWAGLVPVETPPGEYRWTPPGSAYSLFVRSTAGSAWATGIETSVDNAPTAIANIGVDVEIDLPAFTPTVEVFINIGIVSLHYRTADGTIALDASPWIEDFVLWPTPSVAALATRFDDALPRVLISGVVTAVTSQFAPGLRVQELEQLIRSPGEFLCGPTVLGVDGGSLDPAKLTQLLTLMNSALDLPAGPGLQLPGDVSVVAGPGAAAGATRITVTTTSPIGGVLALGFSIDIDGLRHVTPGGTVAVTTPLTGTWPSVTITFGVGSSGVSLAVAPQGLGVITLLPTFSGLGALQGAAAALLLQVLDAAVGTFPNPRPVWLQHLLAAAGHLGLYDDPGGFAPHATAFSAMLHGTFGGSLADGQRSDAAAAIVDLLTLIPGIPGVLSSTGGLVQWTIALPAAQGTVELGAGWGTNGATFELGVNDLKPTDAPLELGATARVDATGLDASLSLGADLSSIGIAPVPKIIAELETSPSVRFGVRVAPLSASTDDGPLVIRLAPDFGVDVGPDTALVVLTGWALPLAIQVAVQAAGPMLTQPMWSGGPTLGTALTNAGILDSGHVARPLPGVFQMATGFLVEAASLLDLAVGDLHLRLVDEAGRVGFGVSGKQDIALGDLQLSVLFGAPTAWGAAAAEGLLLLLLDTSGDSVDFNLGVQLHGIGVALGKADGTALVSETYLRLGSVSAVMFMDIETQPGLQVLHGGAGMRLGGFGLPISSALGSGGGSNPVASNLLGSGGSGSSSGDAQSVNPAADVDVWYWDDPANVGGPLQVLIGGQSGIFWIPIQAGFGPVYIDEIGLGVTNTTVSLAIDGGVTIAGLSAEVDDLTVSIPYAHVTDPSQWSLDLKGLAIGYSGPAIAIAGGLVKYDGPPVEYDGMLLVKLASVGAIVIGSYSVVGSGADEYTSFAIFGGVFIPIGLPPIINLTGIALGLGYNRRLIVPEDLNQIPNFMLVKALDRPEALANNPMQALFEFREQVPPSRGALWLAAGLRGTSFEIVNITAVLYVALDNGVDIGLLGVARMALPADDAAIVSIELALKARFSSSEGLFSVQAQLTDNSWLITSDCQLTGGFAFFMWFPKSQFLLTLGGYHPSFKPLPQYPVVPRLGFRWSFLGVVQIKGESYFALTNTAVMAGVRFDATYGPDWLQLWFTAYTDILISWDPFHYEVDIGVAVGARLRIQVCFFACCTIDISVSVGASLHLAGPPFHGTVTADLGVTSVTVPFGDDAQPLPPAKHWDEFVLAYVRSNDPSTAPLGAQVTAGLLPAEPAGAPVAPGTEAQPWRLAAEWSFQTQTRMPTRGFALQVDTPQSEGDMTSVVFGRYDDLSATYDFDLAPMYVHASDLTVLHRIVLSRRPEGGGDFVDLVPRGGVADPTLLIDERLFRVQPVIGQMSEATYHFFPDLKPPAAANTLPAVVGVQLDGVAGLNDESLPIPIGTLVDATNYRPLPFARRTADDIAEVLKNGAAWAALAQLAVGVTPSAVLAAVGVIVGDSDAQFATLRADSGLPVSGYDPVALGALVSRRSAPPVLSALSEGFTLEDVGVGSPPVAPPIGSVAGVALLAPRLRSVMQRAVVPAGSAPAVHTSVPLFRSPPVPTDQAGSPISPPAELIGRPTIPIIDVQSDLVTTWDAAGFALISRSVSGGARPTRAARSSRTLRNAALGGAVGRAAAESIETMAKDVLGNGLSLRAGVSHLWELPGSTSWQLDVSGSSAVRVTELTGAGTVIRDREFGLVGGPLDLTTGCGMVAVTALGRLDASGIDPKAPGNELMLKGGQGAVVSAAVTGGAVPVVGWQLDGEVVQTGPTTLLARGAVVSLSKPTGASVRGHVAAAGIITMSRAMLDQEAVRTELPGTVSVIGVLVDRPDQGVLAADAVIVHTDTGTTSDVPLLVTSGNRTLFIYDVAPDAAGAVHDPTVPVSVSVGLLAGLSLAGVVGAFGTAAGWAATLAGSTLTQLVAGEQLTPDGDLQVRLARLEVPNG